MKKSIPALLICGALLAGCEKSLPELDIDFGKSQALVLYLSDVTPDADALAIGSDGSCLLYDADDGQGHGLLSYTPHYRNASLSGVNLLLDDSGVPLAIESGSRFIVLEHFDGTSVGMIETSGHDVIAVRDLTVPVDMEYYLSGTKASGLGSSHKYDLIPFAVKLFRQVSNALSLFDCKDAGLELGSLWEAAASGGFDEFNYADGYAYALEEFADGFFKKASLDPAALAGKVPGFVSSFVSQRDKIMDAHGHLMYSSDQVWFSTGAKLPAGKRNHLTFCCDAAGGLFSLDAGSDSNLRWNLGYIDVPWLKALKGVRSSGDELLNLSVEPNDSGSDRSFKLLISQDVSWVASVTVTQKGRQYVDLSENHVDFGPEGGSRSIKVSTGANTPAWSVWGGPEWVHLKNTANGFTITADPYSAGRENDASVMVAVLDRDNRYNMVNYPLAVFQSDGHGCPDGHHPHMIDLGLGVKWSCMNLGASRYEDDGQYFAWGETQTKSGYSDATYTKAGLGEKALEPGDDAAHVLLGGSWRMPTRSEAKELVEGCNWKWEFKNGIEGARITGKNGNYIYIPVSHNREGTKIRTSLYYGEYWTSTPRGDDGAYILSFNNPYGIPDFHRGADYGGHRSYGYAIRPGSE